jgi:hypothetical protein
MLVKKGVSTRGLRALAGHSFLPPWITMIHGGELPKQLLKNRWCFFCTPFFQEIPVEGYTIGSADRAYSLRT